MITSITNERCFAFTGLHNDRINMTDKEKARIGNGSVFFEIDTAKVYMWDEENQEWKCLNDD